MTRQDFPHTSRVMLLPALRACVAPVVLALVAGCASNPPSALPPAREQASRPGDRTVYEPVLTAEPTLTAEPVQAPAPATTPEEIRFGGPGESVHQQVDRARVSPVVQRKSAEVDPQVAALAEQMEQYAKTLEASLAARPAPTARSAPPASFEAPARAPQQAMPTPEPADEHVLTANQPLSVRSLENTTSSESAEVEPDQSGALAQSADVRLERGTVADVVRAPEPQQPTVSTPIDPLLLIDQRLSHRAGADPGDLAAQLDLQLVRLLRGQNVPTMADLSSLPEEDRDLLAALLEGLASYRRTVTRDQNALAADKARPWVELADRVQSRADLSVTGMALCTSVRTFADYEAIEPLRFTAGQIRPVVFYCEVDGFISEVDAEQNWRTKLSLELRLFTEAGMEVWQAKPEPVTDEARRRRRDFFINKLVQMPTNLTPGRYLLKATVQDLLAGRVSEQTLTLEVVAP